MGFETKGRKSQFAYVDGGYYLVKKPVVLKSSLAVLLPKDWLDEVSMGRVIKYFLLDVRQADIVLKPHYDELPLEVRQ